VSDWAIKVGEVYPDLLEKATKSIRGSKAHFATLHCYPELQHKGLSIDQLKLIG
jgi:hypothetical protein